MKRSPPLGGTRRGRFLDQFGDTHGQTTETDQYDWATGSASNPVVRKTSTTYDSTLASLGIVDHASSVIVYDGSSTRVAESDFYYDQWALNTLHDLTPQHGDPPQSRRGNLTTTAMWVGGSTFLQHNIDYYDSGMVHFDRDPNGAATTYNYPDAASTCGNTFPKSVTPPAVPSGVDLTTSTTWDCNGGVAVSTTDPNGRTVATTGWDTNFWRPTAVQDQAFGYTQGFGYTLNPTAMNTHWGLNATSTVHTNTTLDGLGRVHVSQQEQGYNSPNYDSVETDYDSLGRPSRTTNAYVGTTGQTNSSAPATTTTYDALGRPLQVTAADGLGIATYTYTQNDVLVEIKPAPTGENTKRRQYEYDGLGRLISVCEVTSGTGSGACGQSNPLTGYLTRYSYDTLGNLTGVTQNAQGGTAQTRSFTYDLLSRMTSETNPETGRVSYTYDTDATCGTYTGDKVKRVDNAGNVTCYAYDALHRVTAITTPPQLQPPWRYFVYDSATVAGVAMQNAKGRLAEAYTCVFCSSKSTDEGFSYSARGELKDIYQSTWNSGGYYHINASYWSHGPLQNLTLQSTYNTLLIPTITYGANDASGLDGEGRITKVMAGSGVNPVNSAVFNLTDPSTSNEPLGALLSVNLGTNTSGSDADSFRYDKNTGRLTQYTYAVSDKLDTGTLTWNANASLQQLSTNDQASGIYPSWTNCQHAHDDLGRVSSVDCGPRWFQSFGYDPFGNIRKTISMGTPGTPFQVNYSQATNQITSSGYSYDNNGSLLNDPTDGHSYNWDADGHATCVDGVTITYDALGRAVEQGFGGNCGTATSYRQIVYDPQGNKLALANGQTLVKAFIPLPGGATAIYNASGLAGYRHADWLGSSRLTTGFTTPRTIYDQGTVSVKVANYTAQVPYNQQSTVTSIVLALVAAFGDSSSPVRADYIIPPCPPPGPCPPIDTLVLTSKTNGGSTNYQLTVSSQSNFPGYFSPPSFAPQPSGPTLTGGTDTTPGSGSVRITGTEQSASAGTTALSATAYAPFGENYASTGPNDLSFTGQNQDTTLGIYDFMFRRYSANQGRWISPDPAGLAAVNPMNPQSWNRYAYVSNSPLNMIDPLGLRCLTNQSDGVVVDDGQPPPCDHMTGGPGIGVDWNGGNGDDDVMDAEVGFFLAQLYNTDTNAHAVAAWLQEFRRRFAEEQAQQERQRQERLAWWKAYAKSLVDPYEFAQAQQDAWDKGYYSCLLEKNAGTATAPLFTHAAGELATKAAEQNAATMAGTYYHFTDGRFTAWGKYSKVLVPKAAGTIKVWAGRANVAGWVVFDVELAHSIHDCSEKLQ